MHNLPKTSKYLFIIALFLLGVLQFNYARLEVMCETVLVNNYHPQLQAAKIRMANARNSWPNVKYLNLFNVISQYRHSTATYMGAVIIPSLQMDVPLAGYTADDVYTLGAGMLVPHSFEETNDFIIGAHNIGYSSTALFTPLTSHKLIGRTVLITDSKTVKQYTITATKVIMPSQVDIVFKNAPKHLILLTCTDNNKKRLLVKCEFKNEYSIKHLHSKIKKEVKRKYRLHNI